MVLSELAWPFSLIFPIPIDTIAPFLKLWANKAAPGLHLRPNRWHKRIYNTISRASLR